MRKRSRLRRRFGEMQMNLHSSYGVRRVIAAFVLAPGPKRRQVAALQNGFTLLEVLVSVTMVALMAVALWSVFRISLTSWARGNAYIDANQRQRSVMDLVKKQMTSVYPAISPADLQLGGPVYPIFVGARESVQFISLASLRFNQNPGLTAVSYELVRGDQGSYSLVEREEQYLGIDPTQEGSLDRKDNRVIPLFENLVSFGFEYFDPGTNESPAEWVREWNSKLTGGLPSAISMSMVNRDAKGQTLSRHVVIPILAKPFDPRLGFTNPLQMRPTRRLGNDFSPSQR